MEQLSNILASLMMKFPTDIDIDAIRAANKARREATFKRFSELYPDAFISEQFIFEVQLAESEEKPCENCKSYPCSKTKNQGWRHQVSNEDGVLVIRFGYCRYCRQFLRQRKINQQFKTAKIPALYLGKSFADYEKTPDNEKAVRMSKFVIDNPDNGLYLYGKPGTGKTFLAAIIAQEYIKRGRTVVFADVPSLLDQLKSTFNKDSDETINNLMETLSAVDLLILDDIGTESTTEWAIERLYLIVNNRYTEGKPIIATANYKLEQVAGKLNRTKNSEENVTGNRIVSRLKQICKVVEIGGNDRRI